MATSTDTPAADTANAKDTANSTDTATSKDTATSEDTASPGAAAQTTADLLRPVLADLAAVVAGITETQLHRPTPCTELDVEALRNHVLGWLTNFAAGFADPGGQAPGASIEDYRSPADAAAQVRTAAATLDEAVRHGAAERPLKLGDAAMPGEMALSMILWEYQVHGWDLARATGQDWRPPSAASAESLEFAPMMLTAEYQGEGKSFGPRVRVPEDALPLERLLGLSGRNPGWSHD